jgi:hypothetical protein
MTRVRNIGSCFCECSFLGKNATVRERVLERLREIEEVLKEVESMNIADTKVSASSVKWMTVMPCFEL